MSKNDDPLQGNNFDKKIETIDDLKKNTSISVKEKINQFEELNKKKSSDITKDDSISSKEEKLKESPSKKIETIDDLKKNTSISVKEKINQFEELNKKKSSDITKDDSISSKEEKLKESPSIKAEVSKNTSQEVGSFKEFEKKVQEFEKGIYDKLGKLALNENKLDKNSNAYKFADTDKLVNTLNNVNQFKFDDPAKKEIAENKVKNMAARRGIDVDKKSFQEISKEFVASVNKEKDQLIKENEKLKTDVRESLFMLNENSKDFAKTLSDPEKKSNVEAFRQTIKGVQNDLDSGIGNEKYLDAIGKISRAVKSFSEKEKEAEQKIESPSEERMRLRAQLYKDKEKLWNNSKIYENEEKKEEAKANENKLNQKEELKEKDSNKESQTPTVDDCKKMLNDAYEDVKVVVLHIPNDLYAKKALEAVEKAKDSFEKDPTLLKDPKKQSPKKQSPKEQSPEKQSSEAQTPPEKQSTGKQSSVIVISDEPMDSEKLKNILNSALKAVQTVYEHTGNQNMKEAANAIQAAMDSIAKDPKSVNVIPSGEKKYISTVTPEVKNNKESVVQEAKNNTQSQVKKAEDVVQEAKNDTKSVVEEEKKKPESKLPEAKNDTKSVDEVQKNKTPAPSMLDKIKSVAQAAVDKVKSGVSAMVDKVKSGVSAAVDKANGVSAMVDKVKSGVSAMVDKVKSVVQSKSNKVTPEPQQPSVGNAIKPETQSKVKPSTVDKSAETQPKVTQPMVVEPNIEKPAVESIKNLSQSTVASSKLKESMVVEPTITQKPVVPEAKKEEVTKSMVETQKKVEGKPRSSSVGNQAVQQVESMKENFKKNQNKVAQSNVSQVPNNERKKSGGLERR